MLCQTPNVCFSSSAQLPGRPVPLCWVFQVQLPLASSPRQRGPPSAGCVKPLLGARQIKSTINPQFRSPHLQFQDEPRAKDKTSWGTKLKSTKRLSLVAFGSAFHRKMGPSA